MLASRPDAANCDGRAAGAGASRAVEPMQGQDVDVLESLAAAQAKAKAKAKAVNFDETMPWQETAIREVRSENPSVVPFSKRLVPSQEQTACRNALARPDRRRIRAQSQVSPSGTVA